MDGAGQAGIEGMNGAQYLERQFRIGDRVADQGSFVRPQFIIFII